jgi:predicted ATPase
MKYLPPFHVITGGPGSGKTTTLAELARRGHTFSTHLREQAAACRYRNPVFLAPYWPAIYTTDTERRQTIEEAERTEHAIVHTYTDLGYEIVRLPRVSPAERADFILHHSQ